MGKDAARQRLVELLYCRAAVAIWPDGPVTEHHVNSVRVSKRPNMHLRYLCQITANLLASFIDLEQAVRPGVNPPHLDHASGWPLTRLTTSPQDPAVYMAS